jgi:uncharacterized protein
MIPQAPNKKRTSTKVTRPDFEMLGQRIPAGSRRQLQLDIGKLYTNTPIAIGVEVIHGRLPGPVLLVTAAIHGDELNGIEACRRLATSPSLDKLQGTLILVPI